MQSSKYPKAVLQYVQTRGWNTNITELRDGAYIVAGTRERDTSSERMLLMVVCEPEDEVTAEHLKYLLKAGREKNADSVLVTYTGTVTEKAHEIGEKYGVGVIESEKIRSHSETSSFEGATENLTRSVLTSNSTNFYSKSEV
ncbi:restriction endonuclease, partial [Natrialba swarupiae]